MYKLFVDDALADTIRRPEGLPVSNLSKAPLKPAGKPVRRLLASRWRTASARTSCTNGADSFPEYAPPLWSASLRLRYCRCVPLAACAPRKVQQTCDAARVQHLSARQQCGRSAPLSGENRYLDQFARRRPALLSPAGAELSGAHRLCLFADRRAVDRVADGMPDCVMVWSFLICVEVLSCRTTACRLRHEYVCPPAREEAKALPVILFCTRHAFCFIYFIKSELCYVTVACQRANSAPRYVGVGDGLATSGTRPFQGDQTEI